MRVIDISLPLHPGMIIYPGNPPVRIAQRQGAASEHSEISMGSHTGTHVDAPRHVFKDGAGVDSLALDALIGPCRVLDLRGAEGMISADDLKPLRIKKGERILARTRNSDAGFDSFRDDYVFLGGDAAEYLASKGIALFGMDYISVKQRGSRDNRCHTALLEKGIVIVEGLDLSKAEPGRYRLIVLPLNFPGLDGAPARAVLTVNRR